MRTGPAGESISDVTRLIGYRFPDGSYTIDPEDHQRFVQTTGGRRSDTGTAHPVFGFLATHCGMGLDFPQFMALLGAPLDSGALFGQEDLRLERPLHIGETFTVRGSIVEARATVGAQVGSMFLVTCGLELVDGEGEVVCRSRETYVVPRADA